MKPPRPVVVIGLGNRYRRDDGTGPEVAARIASLRLPVLVRTVERDATSLLDAWQPASEVFLVDAARSGAAPGRVHRVDALAARVPALPPGSSTHGIGIGEAVELARALGRLPARLVVYAIEGKDFGMGVGLSPEVQAAVDDVVGRIRAEIDE